MAVNDIILCTPEAPNDVKLYDPAVGCGGGSPTNWTLNLADSIVLSDQITKQSGLNKADSVTLSEQIAKALGLTYSDLVTLSDQISKEPGLNKSDSITLSDLIGKGIGLNYADLVTLSDLTSLPPAPEPEPTPEEIIVQDFVDLLEMKRREIRSFLQKGVNEITPSVEFGSGLITDFNSIRNHSYPSVWQSIAPISVNLGNSAPLDRWEIKLTIAQKDFMGSPPKTYEDIIDTCDEIAQRLTYLYRNVVEGYKKITMEDFRREPFVHQYADCLSGVDLTFTLISPDQTNVC